jgi:hypothetical protein
MASTQLTLSVEWRYPPWMRDYARLACGLGFDYKMALAFCLSAVEWRVVIGGKPGKWEPLIK